MPVLIEGISVVVLRWAIDRNYPGKWKAYVADCPNKSLCFDDCLAAVAFMAPDDAKAFVARLANRGIETTRDGEAHHVVLVDQHDGPLQPCSWLEVMVVEGRSGMRLVCVRLKDNPSRRIMFPKEWSYKSSLTKNAIRLRPEQLDDRARFLGRKEGLDIYEDLRTGQLAGTTRVMVEGGGEQSLKLELEDICFEVERLDRVMRHGDDPEGERAASRISGELVPEVVEIIKGEGAGMPLAYHTLGLILRVMDLPEKALGPLRVANKLGPGNIWTVIEIAKCHLDLRSYDDALEYVRQATELDSLRPEAWELRAVAAASCGLIDEGRQAIEEALLLAPDDEGYLAFRDQLAQDSKDNE